MEQKKWDCFEAKNYFQVGIEGAIKSIKESKINEAGASVIRRCFQIKKKAILNQSKLQNSMMTERH